MALSKRFGLIPHTAESYEEKRSEEHEILRKLIGKTSLFKYSTPLEFTSEDRDQREITGNDSEEEIFDPQWKAEFQAILRKSKQKTMSNGLQDFGLDCKATQENHNQTVLSRHQYPLDQVLKSERTESSVNKEQASGVLFLTSAGTVSAIGKGNTKDTDSVKLPLLKHSKENVMNVSCNNVVEDNVVSKHEGPVFQNITGIIEKDDSSRAGDGCLENMRTMKIGNFSKLEIPFNDLNLVNNNSELQSSADALTNCNRYKDQYLKTGIDMGLCGINNKNQAVEGKLSKEIELSETEQVSDLDYKIENDLVDNTNLNVHQATYCTTDLETDLSAYPGQHDNTEKGFAGSKEKHIHEFSITSNIKQPCQKRSKQEHVNNQHDDGQKENIMKKVQACNTKEIKSQKNVIKVVQAVSFPLDELLPIETDRSTKVESPYYDKKAGHKCHRKSNNASINIQSKPPRTDFEESVFHGEVYNSPHGDSVPTHGRSVTGTGDIYHAVIGKSSPNEVSEYLDSELTMASSNSCRDTSLENFSFIMDSLHNGNSSFVEHLQNVLSQQIRCNVSPPDERSEEKSRGFAMAGHLNCPSHVGYGFYNELNSDVEESYNKNWSELDIYKEAHHKRNEDLVSEKGDNLDKQSKELCKLFIQQCSQLVRTEQDKKMLESLVQLLKKESGTDLGIIGSTPPSMKHKMLKETSQTESVSSANVLVDKDIELFEGRTLLKGFVQPRHIPKTTTVKSGRDKPTDPRPVSTLLAKTSAKPLPLPQFVHDLRDDSVIQRILTLDWDSKRVLFPDETLNSDVNKRDFDAMNLYNPSTDLQKYSKLRNTGVKSDLGVGSDSLKQEDGLADLNVSVETPVKDEQNKSVHDKECKLYIKVYGKVKGGINESSADRTDGITAQSTNSVAGTCSKSAKRALGCDFSKAEEDENILKGRPFLPLFTTLEQQKEPLKVDTNEIDAISASVADSVDKLGTLLEKTYGSKSFIRQNLFDTNTNFISDTGLFCEALHDNENKEFYPKKYIKDKKADNTVGESGNQTKTGKEFYSEKYQNKTEQPCLEIRSIPTQVSILTSQTSGETFGKHDSNSKNSILFKDAQDNQGQTGKTNLPATSNESKTTKPCVGIVKPMQVIVVSDEDESSSQTESTRAKFRPRTKSILVNQENLGIASSITATYVKLEENSDYEINQSKSSKIEKFEGTNSRHINTDEKQRKRKHLPNVVAQEGSDFEEGQVISDSGSELDIKCKKSEKKNESMRRAPHVKKRHYRERKSHSSSSSVESLNFDNWPERSEVKQRHKSSRNSSTAGTKGSRRTLDTHKINRESSKDSRKGHHTVHEGQQFSTGKISCRDTKETRRQSEDSKVLHKCEHGNVQQNTQIATTGTSSKYESILSPEYSSLSDEMLSEEYHRLFGKLSTAKVSDNKLIQESVATKSNFTNAPVKVSSTKSLEEDKAFLQQYKQKVQRKEVLGLKCEIKMEKNLSIEQELEDRKFLQSCKKKLEEKAKKIR